MAPINNEPTLLLCQEESFGEKVPTGSQLSQSQHDKFMGMIVTERVCHAEIFVSLEETWTALHGPQPLAR